MNSILVDIYKEDKVIYYKYQLTEKFLEDEKIEFDFSSYIYLIKNTTSKVKQVCLISL